MSIVAILLLTVVVLFIMTQTNILESLIGKSTNKKSKSKRKYFTHGKNLDDNWKVTWGTVKEIGYHYVKADKKFTTVLDFKAPTIFDTKTNHTVTVVTDKLICNGYGEAVEPDEKIRMVYNINSMPGYEEDAMILTCSEKTNFYNKVKEPKLADSQYQKVNSTDTDKSVEKVLVEVKSTDTKSTDTKSTDTKSTKKKKKMKDKKVKKSKKKNKKVKKSKKKNKKVKKSRSSKSTKSTKSKSSKSTRSTK